MEKESSTAPAAAGRKIRSYDILFEIFLRLPVSSVVRFRKVCKTWHSLATDPSLPPLHACCRCDDAAGPNSMLIHCDPHIASPNLNLCIVNADVHNNRILQRDIRIPVEPKHATNLGILKLSCHGLLCFASGCKTDAYYICNPITKTWTTVAASLNPSALLKGFYFHGPTREYRLLQYFSYYLLDGHSKVGCEVAAVNGDDKSWRTVYEYHYPSVSARSSLGTLDWVLGTTSPWDAPSTMDGNLHWLPESGKDAGIIVFDTTSEKFRSISIPSEIKQGSLTLTLLKIGGNLCIGRLMSFPEEMELWMLEDYHNQKWKNTQTIISSKGIARTPSEDADKVVGNLLKRCYWNISQFSLYDFKYETCCHTHIQHVACSRYFVDYTESLVVV